MNQQKFRVFKIKNRWAVRQPGCPNSTLALCLFQAHIWCGNFYDHETAVSAGRRYALFLESLSDIKHGNTK